MTTDYDESELFEFPAQAGMNRELPAQAGMNRIFVHLLPSNNRVPRASGDEPSDLNGGMPPCSSSPRKRG